jgi:hypothetical protein
MGAILFFAPTTTTLLATIAKAIIGLCIYVILLAAVDSQARKLLRQIWDEIRGLVGQSTSREQEPKDLENGKIVDLS